MEIQLEQLALFQSDEMLFSSVKSEGRVCISKVFQIPIFKNYIKSSAFLIYLNFTYPLKKNISIYI